MSGDTLETSVANDLREVANTLAMIGELRTGRGVSSDVTFGVELAVDELFAHTISRGYDDDGDHRIDLSLRQEGGTLVVEIVDDSRAFDPLQAPEPDLSTPLEERAVGGLGIYLVRKTMDATA